MKKLMRKENVSRRNSSFLLTTREKKKIIRKGRIINIINDRQTNPKPLNVLVQSKMDFNFKKITFQFKVK